MLKTNVLLEKFKEEAVPKIIKDFDPKMILLFGSYARGDADEDSDIDVIVVSEEFSHIPFLRRMPLILKKVRFDRHIDFICYSPKEFEKIKNTSSIVMDALKYGIKLN